MKRIVAWGAGVALLVVAGCSAAPQMDSAGVEDAITTELQPHLEPATIDTVDCPDDVPVGSGSTFTCAVTVAEATFDVDVTQQDTQGGIEFAPTEVVIVTGMIEEDLDTRLHEAYDEPGNVMDLDVDCAGPAVRVVEVGDTFDCEITADATVFVERVEITDESGTVSYLVVE